MIPSDESWDDKMSAESDIHPESAKSDIHPEPETDDA